MKTTQDTLVAIEAITKAAKEAAALAGQKLGKDFSLSNISFDIRGTTAGKAFPFKRTVKFNLPIAIENMDDFLKNTVVHEVAHVVADNHFGVRCKHGYRWAWVMRVVFGVEPKRCHSYNVEHHRIRRRNSRSLTYRCSCGKEYLVSKLTHQRIRNGIAKASCKVCGARVTALNYVENPQALPLSVF